MGKQEEGMFGPFTGKVGHLVGSRWKNQRVVRTKPRKSNKELTPKQLEHHARFALASQFISVMKDIFDFSYTSKRNDMTEGNLAHSHLMKNAVTGVSPNLGLDYTQVLVSKGSLSVAKQPGAIAGIGTVSFTWADNSGTGKSKETDRALLVAFDEEKQEVYYGLGPATRKDQAGSLSVPVLSGKKVHTWIAFIAADRKESATSVYTGELTIA